MGSFPNPRPMTCNRLKVTHGTYHGIDRLLESVCFKWLKWAQWDCAGGTYKNEVREQEKFYNWNVENVEGKSRVAPCFSVKVMFRMLKDTTRGCLQCWTIQSTGQTEHIRHVTRIRQCSECWAIKSCGQLSLSCQLGRVCTALVENTQVMSLVLD